MTAMPFSLVCLPFAGSGAGFYRAWAKEGVEGVRVVPLQLPGREERFVEAPYTDVAQAVRELVPQTLRLVGGKGPVALFGHSLGAVLAYEIARELEAQGFSELRHLFVSGSPGPRNGREQQATGLDEDEFLVRVAEFAGYRHDAFDDPELRDLLLPVLRADVAMHESYQLASDRALSIPVTALRGTDDELVSAAQTAQWSGTTRRRFETEEFTGGHMYLVDSAKKVLETVVRSCRP
jgi:surfactin synthase thioesterase subunit